MRRILFAAMALALAASCRGEGGTEGRPPAGVDEPGEGQPALSTVGGTVTEASQDRVTVVTTQGELFELRIAADAQIMQDENPVQRDRLEEGASVRASFREQGGERIARRIDIDSPAGARRSPSVVPGTQGMEDDTPQKQQPGQQQPGQQEQ